MKERRTNKYQGNRDIKEIKLEEGTTTISAFAFSSC